MLKRIIIFNIKIINSQYNRSAPLAFARGGITNTRPPLVNGNGALQLIKIYS